MEKAKADAIFMQYKDIIPTNKQLYFKKHLDEVDDRSYDTLLVAKTHNPTTVLLCSIFLGVLSVDRFMIGDIGLGVAKLLFGWLTFGIWHLIDIFLCYKKAKEKNLQNLLLRL